MSPPGAPETISEAHIIAHTSGLGECIETPFPFSRFCDKITLPPPPTDPLKDLATDWIGKDHRTGACEPFSGGCVL